MRRLLGAAALLLAASLCAMPALGEEGWGYDLAHELMSPYCPGRALAECPSEGADRLRQWILQQEAAGVSREEVVAKLEAEFGDRIRQTPRAEGVGLVAYAIPIVTLLAGGALLAAFLRRQGRSAAPRGSAPAAPAAPVDPELERRMEEELGGR